MLSILAFLLSLGQAGASALPAIDVSAADIQAMEKNAIEKKIADMRIRTVDAGGHYIGFGLVHRPPGTKLVGATVHDKVSEVYQVIAGSGTLVTGGTLVNPARREGVGHEVVTDITGPGTTGTHLEGGVRRQIGVGDVVIIPAGTPHWFSEIQEAISYTVVRVDPERVVALK